jgi:predicted 3-demethylubiquinone-9 3-methyltransferase (glyoxalase superfamily)
MYDNRETTKAHAMIPSLMYTHAMAGKAEEAMNFYITVFPNSSVDFLWRYEAGGVDKE